MSIFRKSKPANVTDAQSALEQKQTALTEAQATFDAAERELYDALNSNPDSATKAKATAKARKAEENMRSAQDEVSAAQSQLEAAQTAEHDAQQAKKDKQLRDTLDKRTQIARALEKNAEERADLFNQWGRADDTLAELKSEGMKFENAPGHRYNADHLSTILELEDGRHGVPHAPVRWHPSRNPTDPRPSLVETVDYNNDTLRSGK